MKKTDFAMIILIAVIFVTIAFFVTKSIVGTPSSDIEKVKHIDPIEANLPEVDKTIFNKNAINPAIKVQINGDGKSTDDADDIDSSDAGNQTEADLNAAQADNQFNQ